MAIIQRSRPMLDARLFTQAADPRSTSLLDRQADVVRQASRAVGRLHLDGSLTPDRAGSAFLIGDRLAVIARFSAETFVKGIGDSNLELDRAGHPRIAFGVSGEAGAAITITAARFVHPYFDLALVEIEESPDADPLTLEAVRPLQLAGREVVVIGFPQADPRHDSEDLAHVAPEGFGGMKIQPGLVQNLTHYQHHGLPRASLAHDCSTLGGNSGSPVIDLLTGKVLGVHFAGQSGVQNLAVPTWELGRDIRIRGSGMRFSEPLCPWADLWNGRVAKPESLPGSYLRQDGNRFVFYQDGLMRGEVTYPSNHREALSQLLQEVFVPLSEMREFLRNFLGKRKEVVQKIRWNTDDAAAAFNALTVLEAEGVIEHEFFNLLATRADLRAIVVRWIESQWCADARTAPAAAGVASERETEDVVRAELAAQRCACHQWPGTFDATRQRIVPVENLRLAIERCSALVAIKLTTPFPKDVTRGMVVTSSFHASGLLVDARWVLTRADALKRKGIPELEIQVEAGGEFRSIAAQGVVVDQETGWALLPLDPPVTRALPAVLRTTPVRPGEPVTLLYNLNHREEPHISWRDSAVIEASDDAIRFVVSQSPGSWACPVVDAGWQVVAFNLPSSDPTERLLHTIRCGTGVPVQRIREAIRKLGVTLEPRPEPVTVEEPAPPGSLAVAGSTPSPSSPAPTELLE